MLLRKKAQSTAEYAIIIALVIAVAAGVLQVALKNAVRQKHQQAVTYMINAGNATLAPAIAAGGTGVGTQYLSQEFSQTKVDSGTYVDTASLSKGGSENRTQSQTTNTTTVNVERVYQP